MTPIFPIRDFLGEGLHPRPHLDEFRNGRNEAEYRDEFLAASDAPDDPYQAIARVLDSPDFVDEEFWAPQQVDHGCFPPAWLLARTSRRARGQRNTNAEYLTNGILSHPEKYLTDDDVPNVNLDGCYP